MTPTPNLAGMRDALERKRQSLGQEVTFVFEPVPTWPPGTQLDPISGRPYDPLVEPTEEDTPDPVVKQCSVAFRPPFQEDTEEKALGDVKTNVILVWLPLAEADDVVEAIAFCVKGERYRIRKQTEDGIGEDFRWLVWGEREAAAGS